MKLLNFEGIHDAVLLQLAKGEPSSWTSYYQPRTLRLRSDREDASEVELPDEVNLVAMGLSSYDSGIRLKVLFHNPRLLIFRESLNLDIGSRILAGCFGEPGLEAELKLMVRLAALKTHQKNRSEAAAGGADSDDEWARVEKELKEETQRVLWDSKPVIAVKLLGVAAFSASPFLWLHLIHSLPPACEPGHPDCEPFGDGSGSYSGHGGDSATGGNPEYTGVDAIMKIGFYVFIVLFPALAVVLLCATNSACNPLRRCGGGLGPLEFLRTLSDTYGGTAGETTRLLPSGSTTAPVREAAVGEQTAAGAAGQPPGPAV